MKRFLPHPRYILPIAISVVFLVASAVLFMKLLGEGWEEGESAPATEAVVTVASPEDMLSYDNLAVPNGVPYAGLSLSPDASFGIGVVDATDTVGTGITFLFDRVHGHARILFRDFFLGAPAYAGENVLLGDAALVRYSSTGDKETLIKDGFAGSVIMDDEGKYGAAKTTMGIRVWKEGEESVLVSGTLDGAPLVVFHDGTVLIAEYFDGGSTLKKIAIGSKEVTDTGIALPGDARVWRKSASETEGYVTSFTTDERIVTRVDLDARHAREIGRESRFSPRSIDVFENAIARANDCLVILYTRDGSVATSLALPRDEGSHCQAVTMLPDGGFLYETVSSHGERTLTTLMQGGERFVYASHLETGGLWTLTPDRTTLATFDRSGIAFFTLR